MRGIDINEPIGKIYSNYEVLSFEYFKVYTSSRQPHYLCKCNNCNELLILGLWYLKESKSNMCKSCRIKSRSLPSGEASINKVYRGYMSNALKRDYNFDLTRSDFMRIINKNCHYCNSEPSNIAQNQNNTGNYIYNGIDRIDNTKGYTLSNVISCCKVCNIAKSNLSVDDFKAWINKLFIHDVFRLKE